MRRIKKFSVLVVATAVVLAGGSAALADFTVGLDGVHGNWNTLYAQGFSPSVEPVADPGLAGGDTVYLRGFEFYKSGSADVAADIRLAILSEMYPNMWEMSTSSSFFVGLSDNTITDTSTIALGDPIAFSFSDLPLVYGGNYSAVYVTVDPNNGALTPIQVPSMTVDYAEDPNGDPNAPTYSPTANYGGENNYDYATSNFINTSAIQQTAYFNGFDEATDADFLATFGIPEPSTVLLGLLGAAYAFVSCGRRRSLGGESPGDG